MVTMSKLGIIACCAWLLAAPAWAQNAGQGAEQVVLHVDRPIAFTPGFLPAQVICDDLSIVRVEDAGTSFRITGLKEGSTLCSFWATGRGGIRRLFRFVVAP
jgi:hypothetical protein